MPFTLNLVNVRIDDGRLQRVAGCALPVRADCIRPYRATRRCGTEAARARATRRCGTAAGAVPKTLDLGLDKPVLAVAAVVDGVYLAGVRVDEHEEVMTQQIHVSACLFGGHRLQRKPL